MILEDSISVMICTVIEIHREDTTWRDCVNIGPWKQLEARITAEIMSSFFSEYFLTSLTRRFFRPFRDLSAMHEWYCELADKKRKREALFRSRVTSMTFSKMIARQTAINSFL